MQTPFATNYDVSSATWTDLKATPLLSAMEVIALGHGPSWSPIKLIQVSMLLIPTLILSKARIHPCAQTHKHAQIITMNYKNV